MDAYMSEIKNKLNIDQLLGNLSKNDLVGANGISSNGLASLVENIIHEIMNKEKREFLNSAENDKSNGTYQRSLNTSVGKLKCYYWTQYLGYVFYFLYFQIQFGMTDGLLDYRFQVKLGMTTNKSHVNFITAPTLLLYVLQTWTYY